MKYITAILLAFALSACATTPKVECAMVRACHPQMGEAV